MFSLIITIISIALIAFLTMSIFFHSMTDRNNKYIVDHNNIVAENINKNNLPTIDKNIEAISIKEVVKEPTVINNNVNNYDFSKILNFLLYGIGIFFITKLFKKIFDGELFINRKTKSLIKKLNQVLASEDRVEFIKLSNLIEHRINYNELFLKNTTKPKSINLQMATDELKQKYNFVSEKLESH